MNQTGTTQIGNGLTAFGEKIFLDRYALKDGTKQSITLGDRIIVCTDRETRRREVGVVRNLLNGRVTVALDDGSMLEQSVEDIDKPLELHPSQMLKRVARGLAAVEASHGDRCHWERKFGWLLSDWKFVPGGRILSAAGTDQELTFFNCFVLPSPQDSRQGIIASLSQIVEILSRGGGVGVNLSSLRPRHAYVRGVNGRSSGPVSWGGLFSFATGLIEQSGSRRGAMMLVLDVWHPDVLEFIVSKQRMDDITNANISVGITDAFMDAVKADLDWQLVFPDTRHPSYDQEWDGDLDKWCMAGRPAIVHRTLKARYIWDAIISSAWASAEPGVWFVDRANAASNSYYYSRLVGTNPCGEEPLPAWGNCTLGALNLGRFVSGGEVLWNELRTGVHYAVRFLDDAIDATPYFFAENLDQQRSERRLGLGIMGLADMLIRLHIRYGSDECISFIDRLGEVLATEAYLASSSIAAEKGSFPRFDCAALLESGYMRNMPQHVRAAIRKNGLRNITLLTIAPTGTTGTMVDTSTGIEPYFSWSYLRRSRLGDHKQERVTVVREWEGEHPNQPLPDYFVTAMDLAPIEHIKVQASLQRWIDSAIAKTCNVPSDYTIEQTRQLYELMYQLGCKGGTIYRDGCRGEQVLEIAEPRSTPKELTAKPGLTATSAPDSLYSETPLRNACSLESCPSCGETTLLHEEGCAHCSACGFGFCP